MGEKIREFEILKYVKNKNEFFFVKIKVKKTLGKAPKNYKKNLFCQLFKKALSCMLSSAAIHLSTQTHTHKLSHLISLLSFSHKKTLLQKRRSDT